MASQLALDLEALLAMNAAKMSLGSIAATLRRSPDWCARQLELARARDEQAIDDAAAADDRLADWFARRRAAQEKGRDNRYAAQRQAAVEPSGQLAEGDGVVERTFHTWPAGYGAAVREGERLWFIDTGPIRLSGGAIYKDVAA